MKSPYSTIVCVIHEANCEDRRVVDEAMLSSEFCEVSLDLVPICSAQGWHFKRMND